MLEREGLQEKALCLLFNPDFNNFIAFFIPAIMKRCW
jgi:hypothetical protein